MINLKQLEVWLVTGSQHLYGEETLNQVAANSIAIANALNNEAAMPVTIVYKPTVKSTEEIFSICQFEFILNRILLITEIYFLTRNIYKYKCSIF